MQKNLVKLVNYFPTIIELVIFINHRNILYEQFNNSLIVMVYHML